MIKSSFPNLKSRVKKPNTAPSNKKRSLDGNSTMDMKRNDSFELSPEITISAFYKRRNIDVFYTNELKRLDEQLDSYEIEIEAYKFTNKPKGCINLKECETYLWYLEGLSLCVKQKDSKLGNCVLRGLMGHKKAFKNLTEDLKFEDSQDIQKILYKDSYSQTLDNRSQDLSSPDLDSLKVLGDKLKNLKLSRITNKLCDLYDSLCQMHTDVPSPTETPEVYTFDVKEAAKSLEADVQSLRNTLTMKMTKKKMVKTLISKDTQTDKQIEEKKVIETILQEKELEAFQYKHKYELALEEINHLKENLLNRKTFITEERKYVDNSKEIFDLKFKINGLEEENRELHAKSQFLIEKLAQKKIKIAELKRELQSYKNKMIGKRNKIREFKDNLFQTQIL